MAMYAGKHFAFRILRKHLMYDIGMACKASALCHALIPRLNSDGFVEILQRECQGMIESVIGLGKQSSQVIMRKMAVVADRDMTMARILPRVIMPLHHMTIGASCWIIAQVAPTLAIAECERADPD